MTANAILCGWKGNGFYLLIISLITCSVSMSYNRKNRYVDQRDWGMLSTYTNLQMSRLLWLILLLQKCLPNWFFIYLFCSSLKRFCLTILFEILSFHIHFFTQLKSLRKKNVLLIFPFSFFTLHFLFLYFFAFSYSSFYFGLVIL